MLARAALIVIAMTGAARADTDRDPRKSVGVPNPVTCPAIAKPAGDPKALAAPGLLVSPEGFLRADIGLPEAVALLGQPVLCNDSPQFGFMDMYLMPIAPGAERIELETHDGSLIGIIVELDPPVAVDVAALRKKYGKQGLLPAPEDSFEPGGAVFDVATPAFTGQLMYRHRKGGEPDTAWKVSEIIFRRTSLADSLPEGFHTEADVDRLVALALRMAPPDTVELYGTLGVFGGFDGNRVKLGMTLPVRNVKAATMERRHRGARDLVHSLSVTFSKPIPVGKPAKIAGVTRTIAGGKLTQIAIVRDEP
jgi:hypothetical protein